MDKPHPAQPKVRFGDVQATPQLDEWLPDEVFLVHPERGKTLREQGQQVYIAAEILEKIRNDLDKNPRIERGGLLVGHAFRDINDRRTAFTVITGAISQPSQDSSVGHYTVTPAMSNKTRHALEQHFPGRSVVGWYHSHPGHGVFLSEQDMQIVRSLYNAPWQLAFVRDTVRRQEGMFYGPNGRRLDGWLEMKTAAPDFIRAADLYGQLRDAPADQQPRLLDELRALVANSPFLSYWRSLGGYQKVALFEVQDAIPDEPPGEPPDAPPNEPREEGLIILLDEAPEGMLVAGASIDDREALPPPAEPDGPDQILRSFHNAIGLAERGNIQSGLALLRELAESNPDLPYIREQIRYWERKDQFSQPRRPGPSQYP